MRCKPSSYFRESKIIMLMEKKALLSPRYSVFQISCETIVFLQIHPKDVLEMNMLVSRKSFLIILMYAFYSFSFASQFCPVQYLKP